MRRVVALVGLLGVFAVLVGCGSGGAVRLTEHPVSEDVVLTADWNVQTDRVTVDYQLENKSADAIWVVQGTEAWAVSDDVNSVGVVLAPVFFPVRPDVNYFRAPFEWVVLVEPSETVTGTISEKRPFRPFNELKGGRSVNLPAVPRTARLCVGFVLDADLPTRQKPHTEGEESTELVLERSIAHPIQHLACTDSIDL